MATRTPANVRSEKLIPLPSFTSKGSEGFFGVIVDRLLPFLYIYPF